VRIRTAGYNFVMETNWQISKSQKELLDSLFDKIDEKGIKNVLDVGSGRTTIFYLTDRFKDLVIKGIVYPGDTRKIDPIKECVKNTNYELIETEIKDFNPGEPFDVVLAHLFLGEAEHFGENQFKEVMEKLFAIKTNYLVLVNLFRDRINYNLLLKEISEKGIILKLGYVVSESGDECLGILIKLNN
jgi:cyclopropane fatty-acyl-phospholipid synthase-like methyltransferase